MTTVKTSVNDQNTALAEIERLDQCLRQHYKNKFIVSNWDG